MWVMMWVLARRGFVMSYEARKHGAVAHEQALSVGVGTGLGRYDRGPSGWAGGQVVLPSATLGPSNGGMLTVLLGWRSRGRGGPELATHRDDGTGGFGLPTRPAGRGRQA